MIALLIAASLAAWIAVQLGCTLIGRLLALLMGAWLQDRP
jgi:hypothetical protein